MGCAFSSFSCFSPNEFGFPVAHVTPTPTTSSQYHGPMILPGSPLWCNLKSRLARFLSHVAHIWSSNMETCTSPCPSKLRECQPSQQSNCSPWIHHKINSHLSLVLLISRQESDTLHTPNFGDNFVRSLSQHPQAVLTVCMRRKNFCCRSLREILLVTFFLNFHTFNSLYRMGFFRGMKTVPRYFLLKICFSLWNIILEFLIYCILLLH